MTKETETNELLARIATALEKLTPKEKIINEIEESSKKENYFNEREKIVISNFINKIFKELDLKK